MASKDRIGFLHAILVFKKNQNVP